MNHGYRRSFLLRQLDAFDEPEITLPEIRDKLGISERMIRYWLANEEFRAANVARAEFGQYADLSKENSKPRWHFNVKKLRLWLIAIGSVPAPTGRKIARNPPLTKSQFKRAMRDEAREELGLPEGFRVK